MTYIENKGVLVQPHGEEDDRYLLADILSESSLKHIISSIQENTYLQDALSKVFGGDDRYKFLGRNEFVVGGVNVWHRDSIPTEYHRLPLLDEWSDEHRGSFVTVLIYFEDHNDTSSIDGLVVSRGSHKCYECYGPAEHISTTAGDAIIFDNGVRHRGNYYKRTDETMSSLHRLVLTLNYGLRNNTYADRIEFATRHRDAIRNDASLCNRDLLDLDCINKYMHSKF